MEETTVTEGAAIPEPKPTKPGEPFQLDFKPWLARIAASERRKDALLPGWRDNVASRAQRPSGAKTTDGADVDRLVLPEDWARSKQKAAQLNYQVPKIVAEATHPDYEAKEAVVTADINHVLKKECDAAYMIDECLADVINAAGIMVSKIGLDRQVETIELDVPAAPVPDGLGNTMVPMGPDGLPLMEKRPVEQIVSQKFYWDRVSPADFLWPDEFRSSNWDQSPWLGIQKWMTVQQVKKTYKGKLPLDFKSAGRKPKGLAQDIEDMYVDPEMYVRVTEIWYYAWLFDADKAHPECIRRIVFVEGHDEPVEFEQTDWQEWIPEVPETPAGLDGTPGQPGRPGFYKGLRRLPIRVETLTYVSDMAIPPSDTEAGRSQVRELIRSRSQMLRQRDHSIPVRWYNTNLVDEDIAEQLKRGEWQDFIPMNGPGDRAIGEVARANYPRENFQFQSIIGTDLDRAWSLSNNQLAVTNQNARSATEVNVVQNAGQVRLDYEKWRVNRFIATGASVLFSLMQKFRNGTRYVRVPGPNGEELKPVSPEDLAGDFMFDFLADSSDRVDIATKQANALKMYNVMANSETVNRKQLEKEIWKLHGMDPAIYMIEPQPKGPPPPNMSYRFSGEDMINPIAVAIMLKTQQLSPEEIKAAATLIQDAVGQIKTPQNVPSAGGGAAPAGPQPVEPPETVEPILKRANDGSRMT